MSGNDSKPRAPKLGYRVKKGDKSRAEHEKSYENPLEFDILVQNPEYKDEQMIALRQAYKILFDASLIHSKTQFAAAVLQMYKTPIPLAEAAAICQCSRQYFRNLDMQGKLRLLRSTSSKCFLYPEDILKVLEGRI